MFINKLFLFNLKKYLVIFLLFVVLTLNNLNADTIIYIEYNPIEDAYFRITEVDGIIISEVEVDEDEII